MKKLLIAVATTGLLVACGGVDRDGTRDNIVDGLEEAGLEVDADCIDDALDKYSDDELEEIDSLLEDGETSDQAEELLNELFACVPTS